MIFGSIEIITKCRKCGQPVMLNGPALLVLCNSCQTEIEFEIESWQAILGDLSADLQALKPGEGQNSNMWGGSFEVQLKKMRSDPFCQSCNAKFSDPEALIAAGKTSWPCDACGKSTTAAKPPAWMAWLLPEIVYIIDAVDASPDGKAELADMKPLLFTCPSCGGNLKLNGKDRMIDCTFCQSSIYLPDDLWLRLHPIKKVRPWFAAIIEQADDAGLKQRKLNRDLLIAAYEDEEDDGAEAIKFGADPLTTDHEGRSALFFAAATDCAKLVRILIRHKADVNGVDDFGTGPLNIASYNGNKKITGYLLEAGAAVNCQNKVGVTAIFGAAKNGHAKIVRMLLEAGADASLPNEDGVTPMQRAKENSHAKVMELLKKSL